MRSSRAGWWRRSLKSEGALPGTALETLRLHRQGRNIAEIAAQRALTGGTISTHLAGAIAAGEIERSAAPSDPRHDKHRKIRSHDLRADAVRCTR